MKKDSDIYSLQKELNQVNKDLSGKSNYVFTLFVLLLLVMGAGSIASEPSITGAAVSDITGMSFLDITGKTLLDIAGWGFLEFFRDSSTSSNEENLDEISDSSAYKRGEEIKKPDSMKEEKSAGSIGIPELSTTIKKEKSKPNKGSKDISFVLETDENKDVQKNKQKGKKNVKVKHNNGKAIAKLEIDFDSNDELNFSQVVAQIDFSSNKAVLHADNWTTSVTRRSLYVPSSGKGEVFICPGAVSLEEVNPSCPGYFEISVGEFKNGVYLSEELINGDHYYLATGISGTGAGEITTISLVSLDAGGANENLSLSYTVSETGLRNITDWRLHNGSQFNSIAVLNLPFEGGSNSTFTKDYSTYSNNGTVSGATFNSTGGFNGFGAYEFDGASDYIKITDDASFDFTANENFTIIVWAKFPLQANDFNMLYSKVKSTADFDGYFLYYENRDVISDTRHDRVNFKFDFGTTDAFLYSNKGLDDDEWHQYVVVRNGSNGKMYVDGTLHNESTVGSGAISSTSDLWLGTNIGLNGWFDGELDSFQIYDRALSEEQIISMYNNQTNVIVNEELNLAEIWKACVTVTNSTTEGETQCSNNATIASNDLPQVDSILLNATSSLNVSADNLTLNLESSDADSDSIKNIADWREYNGSSMTSIAILNLPFESDGLNNAEDYSNNQNPGTPFGATFSSGTGFDGNGAFSFDGANDYVGSFSNDLDFDYASDNFTVSAYIKVTSPGTSDQTIISNNEGINGKGWGLFWRSDLTIDFGMQQSGSNYDYISSSTLSANNWYHVVGVWNGSPHLYIDAVFDDFGVVSGGTITSTTPSSGSLRVGEFSGGAWDYSGYIDEVKVFDRVFTSEQILALYNNQTNLIVSQETTKGDIWQACVTPNDGIVDGSESCSNNLTIENTAPIINSIILNSSSETNLTSENLTANIVNSDIDGDTIYNIADWRKWTGSSFTSTAVVNMPFMSGSNSTFTQDFTTYSNNGTVSGAVFNSTGGFDGAGSYDFSGATTDEISIPDGSELDFGTGNFAIGGWFLINDVPPASGAHMLFDKDTTASGIYFRASHSSDSGNRLYFWTHSSTSSNYRDARMTSGEVVDGTWHHIVAVKNGTTATDLFIYVDGQDVTSATHASAGSNPNVDNAANLKIGRPQTTAHYCNCEVSDFKVFKGSLSPNQILDWYNNDTNIVRFENTNPGETWIAQVTSDDGTSLSNSATSNALTVAPDLTYPSNNSFSSSQLTFTWTFEGQTEYQILVDNNSDFSSPEVNVTNATSTNSHSSSVQSGTSYWKVRANNSYERSGFSQTYQFTINDSPTVDLISIHSSSLTNATDENITAIASLSDTEGDTIFNITDWRLYNGSSFVSKAVLNWPFLPGDSTDSLTSDYSTYAYHATVNGATFNSTGGFDGKGGYIFSNGDQIELADNVDLDVGSGNFTSGGWFKVAGTGVKGLLSKWTDSGSSGWWLRMSSTPTNLYFWTQNGASNYRDARYSGSNPMDGNWHHIVVRRNGSGQYDVQIFLDGEDVTDVNVAPGGSAPSISNTGNFNVGKFDSTTYNHDFDGEADDIKFFNSALSNEQIRAWYQNKTNTIVSQETTLGDIWQACVTPTDEISAGSESCANITIINAAPQVDSIILNSTLGTNKTNENLTLNLVTSDADGDSIKNITDWREYNGSAFESISILNVPFEPDGSNNGTDYSTNSNSVTSITGSPVYTSNSGYQNSGAYDFDGSDDRLQVGQAITDDTFTIGAWIYTESYGSANKGLGIYYQGTGSTDLGTVLWINNGPAGGTNTIGGRFNGGAYGGGDNNIISLNTWQYVAWAFNQGTSTWYVDGVFQGNSTGMGSGTPAAQNGYIGAWYDFSDSGRFFNGKIDNLQIWDKVLSQEQIQAIYNNQTNLIVSQETSKGDIWQACVTPNDGTVDGSESCSNNLTILNAAPVVDSISLNATSSLNLTSDNLTLNLATSDADLDSVKNITDWRLNGTSITVINLPFENHFSNATTAIDYSTYENNATVTGATFNGSGGYANSGAYYFDGADDNIKDTSLTSLTGDLTVEFKFKGGTQVGAARILDLAQVATGGLNIQLNEGLSGAVVVDNSGGPTSNIISSSGFNDNIWHHAAVTRSGTTYELFVDGVTQGTSGGTAPTYTRLFLGESSTGSSDYKGYLDDVRIYDYVLSDEQIIYLNNSDNIVIVSQETTTGDIWQACVTPNDGTVDGSESCSNNLTIESDSNTAPTAPTLVTPSDGNESLISRSQLFNWTASTDGEGDDITYQLNLTSDLCPQRTFNTNDTNYTITNLNTTDECGAHYWNVTASDGSLTNTSTQFNFSLIPTIILSFTTDTVNFGTVEPGDINDTDNDLPPPFLIENTGNVVADILNFSASGALFTSVAFPSSYWQFKADNSTELYSFNGAGSLTSWTNVSANNQTVIAQLNYIDTNNSAQVDMRIEVPLNEPPATRTATITIVGAQT